MVSPSEKTNGTTTSASTGTIRSVDKAIDILDLLAREGTGLRLSDIAHRLDLQVSTTHHLIATLKGRGLVAQDDRSKLYRIGYRLVEMASSFLAVTDLYPAALGPLEDLRDRSGETCYLAVLQGRGLATILSLAGSRPLQARRIPRPAGTNLHSTASGKVLIAFLAPNALDTLLPTLDLIPFTPRTITDERALRAELAAIRAQGFALDREEDYLGLECVAAPVCGADGRCVAAVSVSYPAADAARTEELTGFVLHAADRVSANLGAVPSALAV